MAVHFFLNNVLPPIIIFLGFFGNTMGIIVVAKKNLNKIGPVLMYNFLFISDTLYLGIFISFLMNKLFRIILFIHLIYKFIAQIIFVYTENAFNHDLTLISRIGCKLINYFNYALDALSPWCLVYISVEKFISIAHPAKRFLFKNNINQIIYFISLFLFNFVYHISVPFFYEILNFENITDCFISSNEHLLIVIIMDLMNFFFLPFLLMICFSSLLIGYIFKSRRRVNNSLRENRNFKKDIKFAISSLSMNFLFILLNLPNEVYFFLAYTNNTIFLTITYMYFLSYAINFYLILMTNSLFRKEFFSLFSKKKLQTSKIISQLQHTQPLYQMDRATV
jgi:hypothetical protein